MYKNDAVRCKCCWRPQRVQIFTCRLVGWGKVYVHDHCGSAESSAVLFTLFKLSFRSSTAQWGTSVTQIKYHSHIRDIIHSSGRQKKNPAGVSQGSGSCQFSPRRFFPSLLLLLTLNLCNSCGGSTAGSTSLLADSLCCLEYLLHLQEVTTVIL